jgi:hypothetical protein
MRNVRVPGLILFLLGLAAILALYYGNVFTPLAGKTDALLAQHGSDAKQIAYYDELFLKKSSLQTSIETLKNKKSEAAQMPGVAASEIGANLSRGLKSAGVSAKSVSLSGETAAQGGKKSSSGLTMMDVTVTLTLNCTRQQLDTLLNYYEKKSDAVYYVNSVVITEGGSGSAQAAPAGQLTVTLGMTAYYYAKEPAAAAAAKP